MTTQSRLQRALKPSERIDQIWAAMNPGVDRSAAIIAYLDEREEQLHPIARVPAIPIDAADERLVDAAVAKANSGKATRPMAHPQSRSEQKRPPPPDELVGAPHDPIHPVSSYLIASKPVHPAPASPPSGEPKHCGTVWCRRVADHEGECGILQSAGEPDIDVARAAWERDTLLARVDELEARCEPNECHKVQARLIEERDTLRAIVKQQDSEAIEVESALRARIQHLESQLAAISRDAVLFRKQRDAAFSERDAYHAELTKLRAERVEQQPEYRDEVQRELGRRERDGEVAELRRQLDEMGRRAVSAEHAVDFWRKRVSDQTQAGCDELKRKLEESADSERTVAELRAKLEEAETKAANWEKLYYQALLDCGHIDAELRKRDAVVEAASRVVADWKANFGTPDGLPTLDQALVDLGQHPEPAVERAIVVGSIWKQCMPPGLRVYVTIADGDSIEFRWFGGERESCPPGDFRLWFTHVSDPPSGESAETT